jgi:hypothetical protein
MPGDDVAGSQMSPVKVRISVPEGWVREGAVGDSLVAAWPDGYRGPMLPTVVVTDTVDPSVNRFDRYVEAMLVQAYSTLPGHLVHLEVSDGPPETLDMTLAADPLGIDVTVTQRHRFLGLGRAVVATASAADVDWPELGVALVRSVQSLEVGSRRDE